MCVFDWNKQQRKNFERETKRKTRINDLRMVEEHTVPVGRRAIYVTVIVGKSKIH